MAKKTLPSLTAGEADHPAERVVEMPFFLPSRGIEGMELRIAATSVDDAIRHGGRRLKADLIVKHRIFAAMKTPFLFPGCCLDGIKITVPTSKEENAIGKSRRSVHDIAGFEISSARSPDAASTA